MCARPTRVLACNEPPLCRQGVGGPEAAAKKAAAEQARAEKGAMLESSQAGAYVPARSYPGQPTVLPLGDGPDYSPHGRSRSFRGATMSGIEWDEWKMVEALVRPSHTVLEFGARCAAH